MISSSFSVRQHWRDHWAAGVIFAAMEWNTEDPTTSQDGGDGPSASLSAAEMAEMGPAAEGLVFVASVCRHWDPELSSRHQWEPGHADVLAAPVHQQRRLHPAVRLWMQISGSLSSCWWWVGLWATSRLSSNGWPFQPAPGEEARVGQAHGLEACHYEGTLPPALAEEKKEGATRRRSD